MNVCGDVVLAVYGMDVTSTKDIAAITQQVTSIEIQPDRRTGFTSPITAKTKDINLHAILAHN